VKSAVLAVLAVEDLGLLTSGGKEKSRGGSYFKVTPLPSRADEPKSQSNAVRGRTEPHRTHLNKTGRSLRRFTASLIVADTSR
jgi:hypothetical protein